MQDLLRPLHSSLTLEDFQRTIVENMSDRVRNTDRPLLLRSPTGSGKTLMLGRILNDTVDDTSVVWFWFAPYSHLVGQTYNSLSDHCPRLHPYLLASNRQYDHRPGDVLISSAQLVATTSQNRDVYQPRDETVPSITDIVARARAAGFKIGVVVDEAHIGVSSETRFGDFCRRLNPDRMVLATATPRDAKLIAFLNASGYTDFETFSISRDEVVHAHLNKKYIATFIYRPNQSWQTLADLQKTILKRAWIRHLAIKEQLRAVGCATVPLTLVQVANGETTIREAFDYLTLDCKVPIELIAFYEGKDKDPNALTALANDRNKEILIFKEAAGTGFDAPRAFILASTKSVADIDFATQFIGRIMRVDREIRAFQQEHPHGLDPNLDTGYIYLANADAQAGFAQATQQIQRIRKQMEGSLERLQERILSDGSSVITNRPTAQPSLHLRPTNPDALDSIIRSVTWNAGADGGAGEALDTGSPVGASRTSQPGQRSEPLSLFPDMVSEPATSGARPAPRQRHFLKGQYRDLTGVREACLDHKIELYGRRPDLEAFPACFKTEERPSITDMRAIVATVVRRMPLSQEDVTPAVLSAIGGIRAREIKTELTTNTISDQGEVGVEIDRTRLSAEVVQFLTALPRVEPADVKALLAAVVARLAPDVDRFVDLLPPAGRPDGRKLEIIRRDTAFLLIRSHKATLAELFNDEISARVDVVDSGPLPDAMMFPEDLPLTPSARNVYGVLPPTNAQVEQIALTLLIDERRAMRDQTLSLKTGDALVLGAYDGGWSMNTSEVTFANALDEAPFVLWWTRNPDRKDYSTGVARADSARMFYPDFIVCVKFWDGDPATIRMIETKFDTKDAANKSKRDPRTYGRVLFLSRNNDRLHLVNRDGSLGSPVDSELRVIRNALMETSSSA